MTEVPASGPSAGVIGHADRQCFERELVEGHPDLARQLATIGRHPRAGHDRERWQHVNWDGYRARVGVCQSLGPWRIEITECPASGPDAWIAEAEGMPHVPGWYTTLMHAERGIVMSDLPAEIAGSLPFLDRVAAAGTQHPAVLIAGLGLGIVPAWLLANTKAGRVDVVEIDPLVIGLITLDQCATDQWAADPRLHVHLGDALTWQPLDGCALHRQCARPAGWDGAFFDIWDTISSENLPSMHRLHRRYARRTGWAMSWERAECEAMRGRGQTVPHPGFSCRVARTRQSSTGPG
jgi:hypothetical protein